MGRCPRSRLHFKEAGHEADAILRTLTNVALVTSNRAEYYDAFIVSGDVMPGEEQAYITSVLDGRHVGWRSVVEFAGGQP
jgi:hypothetical protein